MNVVSYKDRVKLVKAAIAAGVTFSDFMEQYARQCRKSSRNRRLIQKARDTLERDGELEFDHATITSGSGRGAGGEYVLAWVWVEN